MSDISQAKLLKMFFWKKNLLKKCITLCIW